MFVKSINIMSLPDNLWQEYLIRYNKNTIALQNGLLLDSEYKIMIQELAKWASHERSKI